MNTETLKEFATKRNIVHVAKHVRENQKGYPFITMIDKDNVAENIYFSKKAAETVTVGTVVDKGLMKGFMIGYTKNEAGEDRIKIISNSERVEITDLFD